ncbi:MAG: energy transducer TonB [Sphingomicrobium sp.]
MYRSTLDKKDKGGAIAAVVAIHVALAFALLHMSGTVDLTNPQSVLRTFDVREVVPPPPPPPPPPPKQAQTQKPKEKEGGSAPKNIKREATPVVAPKPAIVLPLPPRIAVSETPRQGTAPTQGASDVRGPGTGAGGVGNGSGSGAGGNGPGGGGDVAVRAKPITRGPRSQDYPPHLRRILASGRSPFVKFTILANGRIANCRAYQSSGDPELDNATCSLVTRGLMYRPALNRRGEAVASEAFYRQAF